MTNIPNDSNSYLYSPEFAQRSLSGDRTPGLLSYVDGVPEAYDCLVRVLHVLEGKRGRWWKTRCRVESCASWFSVRCPRERLNTIAGQLNALVVWMPHCPERELLMRSASLLLVAPDYSRVLWARDGLRAWDNPAG